jgi:hypothetical protein
MLQTLSSLIDWLTDAGTNAPGAAKGRLDGDVDQ